MNLFDAEVFRLILFGAIWVYSAVSFAAFITYKILNKYTNYGDSSPAMDEYSIRGIDMTRMRDEVPASDKYHLFSDYGVNPYEGRKHSIPEQLLKDKEDEDLTLTEDL